MKKIFEPFSFVMALTITPDLDFSSNFGLGRIFTKIFQSHFDPTASLGQYSGKLRAVHR